MIHFFIVLLIFGAASLAGMELPPLSISTPEQAKPAVTPTLQTLALTAYGKHVQKIDPHLLKKSTYQQLDILSAREDKSEPLLKQFAQHYFHNSFKQLSKNPEIIAQSGNGIIDFAYRKDGDLPIADWQISSWEDSGIVFHSVPQTLMMRSILHLSTTINPSGTRCATVIGLGDDTENGLRIFDRTEKRCNTILFSNHGLYQPCWGSDDMLFVLNYKKMYTIYRTKMGWTAKEIFSISSQEFFAAQGEGIGLYGRIAVFSPDCIGVALYETTPFPTRYCILRAELSGWKEAHSISLKTAAKGWLFTIPSGGMVNKPLIIPTKTGVDCYAVGPNGATKTVTLLYDQFPSLRHSQFSEMPIEVSPDGKYCARISEKEPYDIGFYRIAENPQYIGIFKQPLLKIFKMFWTQRGITIAGSSNGMRKTYHIDNAAVMAALNAAEDVQDGKSEI